MVRLLCNALLVAAACFVTGAKLRHAGTANPLGAAQEVNRCLAVLRATASAKTSPQATGRRWTAGVCDR